MRYFQIILIVAAWLVASPLHAQPEPRTGTAPDWVTAVSIPAPNPALRDRPFQALLLNSQTRFERGEEIIFSEMAFLIQNTQGMQGLGTIALPWRPDTGELVIHKVHIVRNGAVIDLLAGGRRFTVARRENNLDSAMLDGVHTAVMQADGLAIGDTLNVAFTIRRRPGVLPLPAENLYALPHGFPIRHLFTRLIWDDAIRMRWRATGSLEGRPRERRTGLGNELLLDLRDAEGAQAPAMAPPRFLIPSTLQVTGFQNWGEISRQLAPHYQRAATLSPDSPLRARIAEIAASTADPGARAMAALRLVQEDVRYFAVTIGDGNYLPATADETWARRYGDCKGKTALLVALLSGLGIEAEPVLVHSSLGDALSERLPQMSLFDHVLVRARIGGRSYWLDGTRTGHRQLEALASSRLGWGLPLRAAGAELEQLPFAPAVEPVTETRITYDGSDGLLGEVPVSGVYIMRGEYAAGMRALMAMSGEAEFIRQAREWIPGGNEQGMDVRAEADDRLGTLTLRFSGRQNMHRPGNRQGQAVTFGFTSDPLSWSPEFARTGESLANAPFLVSAPMDADYVETVILPDGGRGYSLADAAPVDRTIAGVRFRRTVSLEGGRAVARSSVRQVALEIPRAEALASNEPLRQLAATRVLVRGTPGAVTRADRNVLAREPESANEFVERGFGFLQSGALDRAMTDFQRAATLRPEWSRPLSNQAIVMLRRGNLEEAEAMIERAAALNANDFVVSQARGVAQLMRNRPVQAVAALTRSLELEPGNSFTLARRAEAYERLGELDDALADYATILERSPGHRGALFGRARILIWRGDRERARIAVDAFASAEEEDWSRLVERGRMLLELGQNEAATAAFTRAMARAEALTPPAGTPAAEVALGRAAMRERILFSQGDMAGAVREAGTAIRLRPNDGAMHNMRCWARATGNLELARALADCDRALALSPNHPAYLDSRALVKLRLGRIDEAIADATAALAAEPLLAPALYVRGVAHMRKGDRASAERDLAAARRLVFDIDLRYRRYGVTP